MRGKLQAAEQSVMLLTSEVDNISEKYRTLKPLQSKCALLEREIYSLRSKDFSALETKNAQLEKELRVKEESIKSSTRKLDRLRRSNPLLQFSSFLTDIRGDTPSQEDNFGDLQEKYEAHLDAEWESVAASLGASKQLISACFDFLRNRLPVPQFDAVVELVSPESAQRLSRLLQERGYVIAVKDDKTIHVLSSQGTRTFSRLCNTLFSQFLRNFFLLSVVD